MNRFRYRIKTHAGRSTAFILIAFMAFLPAGVEHALAFEAGHRPIKVSLAIPRNSRQYSILTARGFMMIKNIIFITLIAIVLIFVVQNTQVVEFRFLIWTISMSRALMLFGTLAVGLVAGWLLKVPKGKKEPPGKVTARK